jgi:hypothetical protein
MKKPETLLRRAVEEALREAFPGGLFIKIHGGPFQARGIPDLLCCVDGRFAGIELKRGPRDLTAYQQVMLRKIREAGGIAFLARSVEEAINGLKKALGSPMSKV